MTCTGVSILQTALGALHIPWKLEHNKEHKIHQQCNKGNKQIHTQKQVNMFSRNFFSAERFLNLDFSWDLKAERVVALQACMSVNIMVFPVTECCACDIKRSQINLAHVFLFLSSSLSLLYTYSDEKVYNCMVVTNCWGVASVVFGSF